MKNRAPVKLGCLMRNSTDRQAMGYSEVYVPTSYESTQADFEALRRAPLEEWLRVLADTRASRTRRWAAAECLARVGDPRLPVLYPTMVSIPGGTVGVGLEPERVGEVYARYQDTGILREWIEKEAPRFTLTLAPYHIARYPVTNQEFLVFLKETRFAELPSSWAFGRYPSERANHPVYTVSVRAAEAYAQWLADKTRRSFRLPTEAEWEYAASGPQGFEYPWGNEYLPGRANTVETGILSTTPVGLFSEGDSPFGVSDMAGNVEEYVADDYAPYPGGARVADDLVETHETYRIARGGSFTRFRDLARTRRRHGWFPKAIYAMGFRLAESPAPSKNRRSPLEWARG